MASVKDCPKCRLVNPPSAVRCDCGYDFVTKTRQRSYLSGKDAKFLDKPTVGEIVLCVLLTPLGLLLGWLARRQGRTGAARTMVVITLVTWVAAAFLYAVLLLATTAAR